MKPSSATTASRSAHFRDLLLLFSIPAAIALIAVLVVYVPRAFAHPRYDFIYSVCITYRCNTAYYVGSDGRVMPRENILSVNDRYSSYDDAELRYYDVADDSSRSVTSSEAARYILDTSSKSPDGYSLQHDSSNGGFLFWGDYHDGWYLKNGIKKRPISLTATNNTYSTDITFLGWVKK